jgi:hypothetical protein
LQTGSPFQTLPKALKFSMEAPNTWSELLAHFIVSPAGSAPASKTLGIREL